MLYKILTDGIQGNIIGGSTVAIDLSKIAYIDSPSIPSGGGNTFFAIYFGCGLDKSFSSANTERVIAEYTKLLSAWEEYHEQKDKVTRET